MRIDPSRSIPLKTLCVNGSAYERGLQHGESLRALIRDHLGEWKSRLAAELDVEPDGYIHDFLAETHFVPAIERWTPDLLDEVRGIAAGADAPFDWMFARQLSDEEPWYRRMRNVGLWSSKGCSSVGADRTSSRNPIIAQNLDVADWWHGSQFLLRVRQEDGEELLVFSLAGKLGLAGMSSRGLGICCNTLAEARPSIHGLPVDFVVRGYLAQPTIADGVAFLRSVPHASGQNYVVPAANGRVIDLECSAAGAIAWRASEASDRVFHANHVLAIADRQPLESRDWSAAAHEVVQHYFASSGARLAELERWFGDGTKELTVERIRAALSSRIGPISHDGEFEGQPDGVTLGCVIMELGDEPVLHVAPGPPHLTPFSMVRPFEPCETSPTKCR